MPLMPAAVSTPNGFENAVLGTFDNQCLIFRTSDGDIRAFVSLRQLNATDARIGLLAGRGAGAELMQAARSWAGSRGLSTCGWRPRWVIPPRLNVIFSACECGKHRVLVIQVT
ncbi:TDP-fucosamine acetyltransferase [Raoultella terrigena]|uniref:TDP-fucosamine acetyltransferase n=1 Tax=Raoultella terrigena TaxID=577 RepID=A0A4U9DAN3_RAOTE|nr:TDP-fucosamine acetyltransferase [Raoultella terrigena]